MLVSGHSFATRKTENKKARADNPHSRYNQRAVFRFIYSDLTAVVFQTHELRTPENARKKMYCQEMFQSEMTTVILDPTTMLDLF